MSAFNQDSGAKLLAALKRGIENITLNVLNENPRDYHKRGRVIGQDEWGWTLSIDNATYTRIPSLERVADYKQGDVVEVMIPNGQPSNMFIMGRVGGVVPIATLDMVFPVGKVILTTDNVSPATYVPNTTWERITDRVLIGAGNLYTAGSTGGSVTHKHSGGTLGAEVTISSNNIIINTISQQDGLTYKPTAELITSSRQAYTAGQEYITPVIGNTSEANGLPPYLAVNIWKRVS